MAVKTVGLELKLFTQPALGFDGAERQLDQPTWRERRSVGYVLRETRGRINGLDQRHCGRTDHSPADRRDGKRKHGPSSG